MMAPSACTVCETHGQQQAELAEAWVRERAYATDGTLKTEWNYRRSVAQYLRHSGYLLAKGYLESDDVLSVNPEAGRLLEVIIPIENAVIELFNPMAGQTAIAGQVDRKWELDELLKQYNAWYAEKSGTRFGRHPTIPKESYDPRTKAVDNYGPKSLSWRHKG